MVVRFFFVTEVKTMLVRCLSRPLAPQARKSLALTTRPFPRPFAQQVKKSKKPKAASFEQQMSELEDRVEDDDTKRFLAALKVEKEESETRKERPECMLKILVNHQTNMS